MEIVALAPTSALKGRGAPKGEGCSPAAPQPPKTEMKKKTDFVAITISKFLRYLPFSQNQPLKSADA